MTLRKTFRAALAASLLVPAILAVQAAPAAGQPIQGGDTPGAGGLAPKPVTGEQVYKTVCQACHMADGMGGVGAATIPALANNPRLGVSVYPITVVLKGKGAMPWLSDSLTPAQIANVIGYVRTSFGNNFAKPVTEEEVKRMAAALGSPAE